MKKPTVEDNDPVWANIKIKLLTKRGVEVAWIGFLFGLIAAWVLAGFEALYRWLEFTNYHCERTGECGDAGWLIVWLIVTAVIVGVFVGLDGDGTKKESK